MAGLYALYSSTPAGAFRLTRTVKLQEDLSAPVEKGQAVGILTVQSGDTTLAELPLTAAAAVERMTWGDLFTRLLRAAVFG